MRVFVIGRYDPRRAAVMPIMEMQFAYGFAYNNCETKYFVPYIFGHRYKKVYKKKEDIFKDYGIPDIFKISFLLTLIYNHAPHFITAIYQILWHTIICLRVCLIDNVVRKNQLLIFSYDVNALIPYTIVSKLFHLKYFKTLVWVFDLRYIKWKRYTFVYRNASGIVVPNNILIKELNKELKIPRSRFVLSYHPIMEHRLRLKYNKLQLRKELGLNNNKPLVVYTGKIFIGQKEVEYILRSAELLPEYQFVFTGGKPFVIKHYTVFLQKRGIKNVLFTGFLDNYADVRNYQHAADVLVSYYSQYDSKEYGDPEHNLPAKICEYMGSRNPIVTCNRNGVSDLLNKDNALFVEADNPKVLAAGIKKLIEDRNITNRLAKNAYETVREITFEKRTKAIIDFVKTL